MTSKVAAERRQGDADSDDGVASDTVDALAQLSFLVHGMLERRAAERDMSIVLTRMLGILRDRRPTVNRLAELLDLDKSSVSGLVARAERRGLVTRAPSADDRRSVLVSLTDEGRGLAKEVTAEFGGDVADLLRGLSQRDTVTVTRIANAIVVDAAQRHDVDLAAGD
ncbi:MAG TPA: MarR family transcriptional regulator [Humibacter sp.]|jgi:DNA-binding MarR family transcriptional regulator|nr:MarR family transcriptional regulator [Humibacter sp.]